MLTTPRRMTLYWLLLLVPALAVGAGALALLQREQARLDEQARVLTESRRSAIEARARLIAENVELLVSDVQSALAATLRTVALNPSDRSLQDWQQANPLVRTAFWFGPAGELRWPRDPDGAEEAWLQRWRAAPSADRAAPRRKSAAQEADEALRGAVSSNVAQVQSARSVLKDAASQESRRQPEEATPSPVRWEPWQDQEHLRLIGWLEQPSGARLGVEVDLAAIAEQLDALLPHQEELAGALAIRAGAGAAVQRRDYATSASLARLRSDTPIVRIPISPAVLPGWEVVGYERYGTQKAGAGGGFFLVGSLLVGTFVAAIVSGGSLLLWQARRSQREAAQKTTFVSHVSHEFKTPLTTIRLYSELLEQGRLRSEEQGRDYLRTISRETDRLARLVNNALDFSRMEQGQKVFRRESLDLREVLLQILDTHAPRLEECGLLLRREVPIEPVRGRADRDALEQIVLNLLDNACKYAAAGGEVMVRLQPATDGGAEVAVNDREPGVPASHRERIFERFHRVDEALTARQSGAGLGLSISRQLARGMGGDLTYEARPGGGASFVLKLP